MSVNLDLFGVTVAALTVVDIYASISYLQPAKAAEIYFIFTISSFSVYRVISVQNGHSTVSIKICL